jgi:TolB-like protein
LPFSGTTIDEVRDRQQHNPPPAEQLRARRVPQRLIRLVTACLALDPAERPSPGELLRRLETCRARPNYRRYIVYAAAVVIATAGALPLWRSINEAPRSAVPSRDKGLAVLPFENLSANAEDAFLAEGIQDDVLTSVGKIKGLKVIARSSVQAYRGRLGPGKVRELGDALGISHVLEGSVRRTGERVVLNVALIDMQEERQIWAERYDRSLGEMASLHGELAREIGRALQTTLTPFENVAASAKPTANAEAYLLYLKGRELEVHRGDLNKALELYQQAIALDPTFALARARLSKALTTVNYQHNRADVQARARNEAEEALRLQPALGEARVALAHWYLYQNQDLNRAAEELRRAAELLPNWAEVQLTAAFLYKRQNRFRERIAALHRAEALDPRNPGVLGTLIMTSRWVRDWREAMQAADRRAVFTKGPAYLVTPWSRANDEFRLTGDINVLKRAVSQEEQAETPMSPERLNYARFEIATLERDFERAAHFLDQIPAEAFTEKSEPPSSLIVLAGHGKEFHQALLAIASHADSAAAKELFAHARQVTKAAIEALPSVTHGAKLHADVALLHAFAGEKDAAIQNAERAIELQSELSMGIERNDMFAVLALVYAQTGEADKALDLIEQLLTVPIELQDGAVYNMTVVDLKWRWVWDPLRGHPRFQKLIAGPEPQTVY